MESYVRVHENTQDNTGKTWMNGRVNRVLRWQKAFGFVTTFVLLYELATFTAFGWALMSLGFSKGVLAINVGISKLFHGVFLILAFIKWVMSVVPLFSTPDYRSEMDGLMSTGMIEGAIKYQDKEVDRGARCSAAYIAVPLIIDVLVLVAYVLPVGINCLSVPDDGRELGVECEPWVRWRMARKAPWKKAELMIDDGSFEEIQTAWGTLAIVIALEVVSIIIACCLIYFLAKSHRMR